MKDNENFDSREVESVSLFHCPICASILVENLACSNPECYFVAESEILNETECES